MTAEPSRQSEIVAVREFNRDYTRAIGVLADGLVGTSYTLAESRVLFEIARAGTAELSTVRTELGLDSGYLSRILTRLTTDGLVARDRSADDGRRRDLRLTRKGVKVAADLDRRSSDQMRILLDALAPADRGRLLDAMRTVRSLLRPAGTPPMVVLRRPVPGEYGWIVAVHGAQYAAEVGWDATFEALVARIVADLAGGYEPARERAWIAEIDSVPAGCVLCVGDPDDPAIARLRLLLVTPGARGLGIGSRLVGECVAFARGAGYERLTLWTNSVLVSAGRIYQAHGFLLDSEEKHHSFGHDLVGQTWSLTL